MEIGLSLFNVQTDITAQPLTRVSCKSWADVRTIGGKSLINFGSGLTSNIEQQFLTSKNNFNQHRLWVDGILIPSLRKYLVVVRHPKQHPTQIQVCMTLPTRPHAIFSTLQGTHNPDTNQTLQRAKNANTQPTHPC